jgi:hypothetical protein
MMRIKVAALVVGLGIVGLLILGGPLSSCDAVNEVAPSVPPLTSVPPASETPSAAPSETPSAQPVETLCGRVDQALIQRTLAVRTVQPEPDPTPAEIGLPSYDACTLRLGGAAPLRFGVSVLPATTTDLATSRRSYDAGPLEPSQPARVGQGGYGTSRFVVFLAGGRLVKISGPPATLPKYVTLARDAAAQLPGLPPPPPLISRPECDRGSSAAADVLGAPGAVRRDSRAADGTVTCAWITADAVLSSTATTSPAAIKAFETARRSSTAEPVPLGDDAFFDTRTRAVHIQAGPRIASLTPLAVRADRNAMVAFALAISGLYTR